MGGLPRILGAVMGTAARRPVVVGLVVTLLALAGAALALRLSPSTAADTLVGHSSPSWQATQDEHRLFGEDAVYVLVRGPVSKVVLTSDLSRLIGLEGCLAAGLSNQEIADHLFISVKTASVHVSNILRKLSVSGRHEAARVAHRLGIAG